MKIEDEITGIQRRLNHKERHPNDKNLRKPDKGITWKMVEKLDEKTVQLDAIKTAKLLIENAKYQNVNLDAICPKCECGKIVWKGSTKHRSIHCRCSMGCVL